MKNKFYFIIFFSFILLISGIIIFFPIYFAKHLIFPFSLRPFDICTEFPKIWQIIKILFFIFYLMSSIIISNSIYDKKNTQKNNLNIISGSLINSNINLLIGKNEENNSIYLSEKSLYQNILITGTIGTGKTSSAMYPFTRSINTI